MYQSMKRNRKYKGYRRILHSDKSPGRGQTHQNFLKEMSDELTKPFGTTFIRSIDLIDL